MRLTRMPVLIAVLLACVVVDGATAQRAPRRPRLGNQADTNDATLYYQLGLERADRNPDPAFAAFYWAARLDPMSPYPLYGQYAALLLQNAERLTRYIQRDPRTMESREVLELDSLRMRAELLDPFYHRALESTILLSYAQRANRVEGDPFNTGGRQTTASSQGNSRDLSAVQGAAERFFEENDPYSRGGLAYGVPDLRLALRYWAQAARAHSNEWIWADRARAFAELRQWDSAVANIVIALDTRRSVQSVQRRLWERRDNYYYVLGRIYEELRDGPNARAAHREAVQLNDDHFPSLVRLAGLHLAERDTATAIAIMIRVAESPRANYQQLTAAAAHLTAMRRHDLAVAALRKATTLEPFASAGWLILARSLESSSDTAGTVSAYERYLALAPLNDGPRAAATRNLAMLRPGQ